MKIKARYKDHVTMLKYAAYSEPEILLTVTEKDGLMCSAFLTYKKARKLAKAILKETGK